MDATLTKPMMAAMLDRAEAWAIQNKSAFDFLLGRIQISRAKLDAESEPQSAAAHHARTLARLGVYSATLQSEVIDLSVPDQVERVEDGELPHHVPPGMTAEDFIAKPHHDNGDSSEWEGA